MEKINERTILLGIDPSFVTMGVALYTPATKDFRLETGDFFKSLEWIGQNCKMKDVIAVVENPALDSTVFKMWGLMKKEIESFANYHLWTFIKRGKIPRKVTVGELQSTFSICMNYAQKVGENKAAAKMIIKMLHQKKVPVIEIAPSARQKAFGERYDPELHKKAKILKDVLKLKFPTKTNAAQFEKLTGYSGRSSEHARDAGTLIHGRTMKWAEMQAQISAAEAAKQPASTPKSYNDNYHIIDRKKKPELPF